MVREFSKPQEARAIEARARARCCGVRVAVIVAARRYCAASQSEAGTTQHHRPHPGRLGVFLPRLFPYRRL